MTFITNSVQRPIPNAVGTDPKSNVTARNGDSSSVKLAATPQPVSRPVVTPAAQRRVLELKQRIEVAPLLLPKPGAPGVIPKALGSVLGVNSTNPNVPAPTLRGVPTGATLSDRVVLADIGRFLRANGLDKGLPTNWTKEQRDDFVSLLVVSGLQAQGKLAPGESRVAQLQKLGENLQAALALVNRPVTRLPALDNSILDNTATQTDTPLPPATGGAAPSTAAQTLNQRIVGGDIAGGLFNADAQLGRQAYESAVKLVEALPVAEQRSVLTNLDRQYLGAVGQREAVAQRQLQRNTFTEVSSQLQTLPADKASALQPLAQSVLDAQSDVGKLKVAQEMLRSDTNQPPMLPNVVVNLSGGAQRVDRGTISNLQTQAQERLSKAQSSWTAAVNSTGVASADAPGVVPKTPQPKLAPEWQKAAGRLSGAFSANINPYLREVVSEIKAGTLKAKPFDTSATPEAKASMQGEVQRILVEKGQVPASKAVAAAQNLMAVAERADIDPQRLANELSQRISGGKALVASIDPGRPLVIDSKSPTSVAEAKKYFTALLSQGIEQPPRELEIDGKKVSLPAGVKLTDIISDLDGVLAASYGQFGLEVAVDLKGGKQAEIYLPLGKALSGVPTKIAGLTLKDGSQTAEVELETRNAQTGAVAKERVSVPLSKQQAELLLNATNTQPSQVAGLTARLFPPSAMKLLVAVSETAGKGIVFPGGVTSNEVIGNTFGTSGREPASGQNSPGNLPRSIGRSLPGGVTLLPVEPGLPGVPNVQVYSGGAAITGGGDVMKLFGLDARDAAGITAAASGIKTIVTEMAQKYGLSNDQVAEWNKLNFTNADIPSIIVPSSVMNELSKRPADAPNGLPAFQREVESRVQSLLQQNGLLDKYKIHHTPSDPGDQLKVATFDASGKRTAAEFTGEWQINVKGGKALPVLDVLAKQLERDHGIKLYDMLKAEGFDFDRMRKMELAEVIDFLKNTVRPKIDGLEQQLGYKLTGKVVVQADTYYETTSASGKKSPAGSDASMIDATRALYGDDNVTIVQVDTAGGLPMEGRNPYFRLQTDGSGKPTVLQPSVTGGRSQGAPSIYVDKPDALGQVLLDGYTGQQPLTDADFLSPVRQPEKKVTP